MHPKELIFDKSILFFRLHTCSQWIKSCSEVAFLRKTINENWEPRKKTLQIFPQKACLFTVLCIQKNHFLIILCILFFRLHTCKNYLKVFWRSYAEKNKIENWEPRILRTLQIFPQKTCLFTILCIQRNQFFINLSYFSG